jgi:uncharacterized protein YggE
MTLLVPLALVAGMVLILQPEGVSSAGPANLLSAPDENPRTVQVTAAGRVSAPAERYRLLATAKANAPLAEEAIAAFAQIKERASKAFAEAGLEGIVVEGSGQRLAFKPKKAENQNMFFSSSEDSEPLAEGATCSEVLQIFLPAHGDESQQRSELALLIDSASDAGLRLRSIEPNMNNFISSQSETKVEGQESPSKDMLMGQWGEETAGKLGRQARAAAMERARQLATELAEQSGGALGPVKSVSLSSSGSQFLGIGSGLEASARVTVTYELIKR